MKNYLIKAGPKWAATITLSGLLLGLTACHKEQSDAAAPGPKVDAGKISFPAQSTQMASLSVETVSSQAVDEMNLTGRLIWNDDCTVRVFSPVAGRVQSIAVEQGQKVTEGAVLAKVASPDFGQAQADALKAQADLQQAEKTLARFHELFDHGAAAQKDVEGAEADRTRALSEKDRTEARLKLYGGSAQGAVDQMYPLRAPLGGTIVEKNINPGQEVRPDQMMSSLPQFANPLFIISDPAKLWLQLDVTESDMSHLHPGQKLQVASQAYPGKVFEGRIEMIGDTLDPTTRMVKVRAVVNNEEKLLKAEMYVTVKVTLEKNTQQKPEVQVSAMAVFLNENQHYVFVEESPGNYARHSVKTGWEQDGRIQITDGLNAGQKVVTEGVLLLESILEGEKS